MVMDYNKPVDNFYDLEDMGLTLLLPRGTHYKDILRTSPFSVQRR